MEPSPSKGAVKVGGWRYEDSTRYIGEWNQRGQKHGLGHLQFADGTRYDGQFVEGMSHGLGCLWFADGAKYVCDRLICFLIFLFIYVSLADMRVNL